MKDVQGWWEVPSICYYCSLLGNAFGLPDFTIEVIDFDLIEEFYAEIVLNFVLVSNLFSIFFEM